MWMDGLLIMFSMPNYNDSEDDGDYDDDDDHENGAKHFFYASSRMDRA